MLRAPGTAQGLARRSQSVALGRKMGIGLELALELKVEVERIGTGMLLICGARTVVIWNPDEWWACSACAIQARKLAVALAVALAQCQAYVPYAWPGALV